VIRLVLAGDMSAVREVLRQGLQLGGLPCVVIDEAGNGPDALRQVLALVPDAAILDLDMPGMSGVEVVRALRLQGDRTPVILCTSGALPEELPVGVLCHLRKSFRLERLQDALRLVPIGSTAI
jgi:two-component system, NarL family, response regulator DesR